MWSFTKTVRRARIPAVGPILTTEYRAIGVSEYGYTSGINKDNSTLSNMIYLAVAMERNLHSQVHISMCDSYDQFNNTYVLTHS